MTREEAIYELERMKTWSKDLSDNEIEAIAIALKALSSSEKPNKWISSDVIERIKAEITEIAVEEIRIEEKWARGLYYAIKVIDKYISPTGAESEE